MKKITPFLWFDDKAEEAMNFYVSIFKNSKVGSVTRYGEAGPGPKGTVMTAKFQLDGQEFIALNGGPHFKFTEAISFSVDCKTQEEVDELWEKLSRRRRKITVRLAQRQIWFVMADRPLPFWARCWADKDAEKSKRSCRRCSRWTSLTFKTLKQAYEGQ